MHSRRSEKANAKGDCRSELSRRAGDLPQLVPIHGFESVAATKNGQRLACRK
jgi:hypothetical protein